MKNKRLDALFKRDKGDIRVGDIYEDCAYHALRCTEVSYNNDNIIGVSMLSGAGPRGCSLYHCGVRKLTEAEVLAKIEAWEKDGEIGLLRLAGRSEEDISYFMKNWRTT